MALTFNEHCKDNNPATMLLKSDTLNQYYCWVCNKTVNSNDAQGHPASREHVKRKNCMRHIDRVKLAPLGLTRVHLAKIQKKASARNLNAKFFWYSKTNTLCYAPLPY